MIKNVSNTKSENVVTAVVTPEANDRLTVETCPTDCWMKFLIISIFPISPFITNCARFSSTIKARIASIFTSLRIKLPRLKGRLSIIGKLARACCSSAFAVFTTYTLESSARPTKTGTIETRKRPIIRKSPKNVTNIPKTSGILILLRRPTKGLKRSAKKQATKNKPIKSRNRYTIHNRNTDMRVTKT